MSEPEREPWDHPYESGYDNVCIHCGVIGSYGHTREYYEKYGDPVTPSQKTKVRTEEKEEGHGVTTPGTEERRRALATIRADHTRADPYDVCGAFHCQRPWPCDTALVLSELDALTDAARACLDPDQRDALNPWEAGRLRAALERRDAQQEGSRE